MHAMISGIPRRQRGFTLVEIMAVLVVVGIAAGMVTLSMGDSTRPRETKAVARNLYSSMNLALEDAIFLNRQIGLRFDYYTPDSDTRDSELAYSYQWLYYDTERRQWHELPLEGFEAQELPDYIQLQLEVDGQEILIGGDRKSDTMLKVQEDEDGKKGMPAPDLFFLSSGEMQAFRISIAPKESPDNAYVIRGDILGQMTFRRPDEDEK